MRDALPTEAIIVRPARHEDLPALSRLAALDSAGAPLSHDGFLLAEFGGQPRAALPINGGRVIADPFVATADAVALLELRAKRLREPVSTSRRAGAWLRAARTRTA